MLSQVTMNRWVNESVNGRLKNVFPFFRHTIEGRYVPKIMPFVRIACAILNAYFPPLFQDQVFHQTVIEEALIVREESKFKEELEELGLFRKTTSWKKASPTCVPLFPKLAMEDLQILTLGSYQLKMARVYNKHHMKDGVEYEILLHKNPVHNNILRAYINSRFRGSHKHSVWIKYEDGVNSLEGIKERYCDCRVGERSLGCCSHVASVSDLVYTFN
jgi:hypothetical protein